MESLLSLSFDNISSRDSGRISRGLRQIEGLLAQICISSQRLSPHKRKNSATTSDADRSPPHANTKSLGDLRDDAAFREFFRLQDGFQWNVAIRLIETLERLLGMGNASETDLIILASLELLQGVLLLHPPSRSLFGREDYLNLVLDLLDSSNPPRIQSQALLVLVTALLDNPKNTRVFENIDGLLTVTSLFKSRGTTTEVKMRTLEFLYFYLMPETSALSPRSAPNTAMAVRTPSKDPDALFRQARTHTGDTSEHMDVDDEGCKTRTTSQKQHLLGNYISNVEELVADLQEAGPLH